MICERPLFNQALKSLNIPKTGVAPAEPKTFNDIWKVALQEEQCLYFDKHNAENNVATKLSEVKNEATADLAEIKQLLQINIMENNKKIIEYQVQKLTFKDKHSTTTTTPTAL